MIGKVPERISTELLLRELDPGKNIFSDDEKSLIREYGSQIKDERKTKGTCGAYLSSGRVWRAGCGIGDTGSKGENRRKKIDTKYDTIYTISRRNYECQNGINY